MQHSGNEKGKKGEKKKKNVMITLFLPDFSSLSHFARSCPILLLENKETKKTSYTRMYIALGASEKNTYEYKQLLGCKCLLSSQKIGGR